MPYGILLLKRQAISFIIAYLYSAPAAYDTPMLVCVNANSTTSFLTALRLLAMSMVSFHRELKYQHAALAEINYELPGN
jgi:hypothetical protein